jgi:threonine dehydratase
MPPEVKEKNRKAKSRRDIISRIGGTPLLKLDSMAEKLGANIYAKVESFPVKYGGRKTSGSIYYL